MIELTGQPAVYEQAVEIVERKGVGHPDYICDAVAERISVALCREYIKRFGVVLHHNIDKGLLVAGTARKGFGYGKIERPMEFIIGDRATFESGGVRVPVVEIAETAVREWLAENLPHVEHARDVTVRVALRPGSEELAGIFASGGRILGANDTSAAVGYAPFTPTERAVFETERYINSPAFKKRFPEVGEDVKVMGVRTGRDLDMTVAVPFLSRRIRSEAEYFEKKKAVHRAVMDFLRDMPFSSVELSINSLDRRGRGSEGVYLTVTGTSAEDADSGQVGRGNRVNGVISLARPMGTEAAAGKNPVSHTGKIYTIMTDRMAAEIYRRAEGLKEVYVWLLSRIGSPVDRPRRIYVRLVPEKGFDEGEARRMVRSVTEEFLSAVGAFTAELARGEHSVC